MRVSVVNQSAALCCNTANPSLTIDGKFEIINKRIGSVQFESKMLRKPSLHIAKRYAQAVKKYASYKHFFET